MPTGSPIPSAPPWLCPRPTGAPPPSLPAVGAQGLSPPALRPRPFGSLSFFGGVGARFRGAYAPLLAITSPTGWGRGRSPEAPRRFCSCPLPLATLSHETRGYRHPCSVGRCRSCPRSTYVRLVLSVPCYRTGICSCACVLRPVGR